MQYAKIRAGAGKALPPHRLRRLAAQNPRGRGQGEIARLDAKNDAPKSARARARLRIVAIYAGAGGGGEPQPEGVHGWPISRELKIVQEKPLTPPNEVNILIERI